MVSSSSFCGSPQIAIFHQFSPSIPIPLLAPAITKEEDIRCNLLVEEMYSKDTRFPELSIDNAQAHATAASTVSSQLISPAFAPVPSCIFQYEHCRSLSPMDPPTQALLTLQNLLENEVQLEYAQQHPSQRLAASHMRRERRQKLS